MQEEAVKQDGRLLDGNRSGHRKGFKLSWDLLTQSTQKQESRKGGDLRNSCITQSLSTRHADCTS